MPTTFSIFVLLFFFISMFGIILALAFLFVRVVRDRAETTRFRVIVPVVLLWMMLAVVIVTVGYLFTIGAK